MYSDCQYPRLFQKVLVAYMFSLIAFFSNFFYQSYIVTRKPPHADTKVKVNGSSAANDENAAARTGFFLANGKAVGGVDHRIVQNGVKGKEE